MFLIEMQLFTLILLVVTAVSIGAVEQHLTVHIATWNVNEKHPPKDLDQLLGLKTENVAARPDIIVVGLQEVTMSLTSAVKNYVLNDEWTQTLKEILTKSNYEKVKTVSLLGIVLNVYIKGEHAHSMRDTKTYRAMTGLGGFYANKGGVFMKFKLYGQSFCLVNAHFHAHDGKLKQRIEDFGIINTVRVEFCNYSDYVFWLGDLNFRIAKTGVYTSGKIQDMIMNNQRDELLQNEELTLSKKSGDIFINFLEEQIRFDPTYKLVPNTGKYSTNRRSAWTDRVLFKSEKSREITPILYQSLKTYVSSDHFPVVAQFKIVVDTEFTD